VHSLIACVLAYVRLIELRSNLHVLLTLVCHSCHIDRRSIRYIGSR
jgi:hypothetical protein